MEYCSASIPLRGHHASDGITNGATIFTAGITRYSIVANKDLVLLVEELLWIETRETN